MNLKRFTALTSRDALALVRQAFGDDAVVMSTRPCAEGVEVLAMAPESLQQIERVGAGLPRESAAAPLPTAEPFGPFEPAARLAAMRQAAAPVAAPAAAARPAAPPSPATRSAERIEPHFDSEVAQDVEQLQMSTLSFQEYVRQRMLKRREAERAALAAAEPAPVAPPPLVAPVEAARVRHAARRDVPVLREEVPASEAATAPAFLAGGQAGAPALPRAAGIVASLGGCLENFMGAVLRASALVDPAGDPAAPADAALAALLAAQLAPAEDAAPVAVTPARAYPDARDLHAAAANPNRPAYP